MPRDPTKLSFTIRTRRGLTLLTQLISEMGKDNPKTDMLEYVNSWTAAQRHDYNCAIDWINQNKR